MHERPRVAVVHGYFLGESGSEVYARELARSFVHAGCDVTLVCQEPNARDLTFIDQEWRLDSGNVALEQVFEREPTGPGRCRLVRPDLGGQLLVYAPGAAFPGLTSTPMQDASPEQVERFVDANVAAMQTIFDRWPPQMVQANHVVLQPVEAARALRGSDARLVTTFHGSELTFSLSADARLAPYAAEGLMASSAIVALSDWSSDRLLEFAASQGLDLAERIVDIAPGVDTSLFRPAEDRSAALSGLLGDVAGYTADDPLIAFSGSMRHTKGVKHALLAFFEVQRKLPSARLVLAGAGPQAEEMHRLARRLGEMDPAGELGGRIHFLGHRPHESLAPLLGSADVVWVPSVAAEAFALAAIEGAAGGAVPLACYHTGLRTPVDAIAGYLEDPRLKTLEVGPGLYRALAALTLDVLDEYPTRDPGFRNGLHDFVDSRFAWSRCAAEYLAAAGLEQE